RLRPPLIGNLVDPARQFRSDPVTSAAVTFTPGNARTLCNLMCQHPIGAFSIKGRSGRRSVERDRIGAVGSQLRGVQQRLSLTRIIWVGGAKLSAGKQGDRRCRLLPTAPRRVVDPGGASAKR